MMSPGAPRVPSTRWGIGGVRWHPGRLLLLVLLLQLSCNEEVVLPVPAIDVAAELAGTRALPPAVLTAMEGVYEVIDGQALLGREAVVKHTGSGLSIFTDRDAGVVMLECGIADSAIIVVGTWRKLTGTETGVFRASISELHGAARLLAGGTAEAGAVTVLGDFGNATGKGMRPLQLVYRRPLYHGPRPFLVIAHRAGGRNSDHLPASENTAELVRMAERFGANGVEIDVQVTRDGVPVVYHDETLNLRLTQKSGLVGSISDYTLAQIESFVRLKNGERIPTLRRMLGTILRQTTLRFVWLDSKYTVPVALLRDLQRAYVDSARHFNRDLTIVIGLPDAEKVDQLLRIPDYEDATVLCELDVETVRRTHAEIWAPRWTMGTQNALVAAMHAEGRLVLSWTLDNAEYIQQFLRDGDVDGILSNYPSLVAYYHFVQ
ncbi:MAG: glycerophosphodiester phosphodiesterase [Bacteroidota bacterium]|nr:glycerophosphodiester phosphodiesterase [Bacteroidota bacterium]